MLPTAPDRVLALDIGGTKLAAGVVAADGTVCSFESMPTRVERGPEPVMASLVGLARRVLVAAGTGPGELAAAGISCGGPLDPVKGVVYGPPPNLPGWSDVPVVDLVSRRLRSAHRAGKRRQRGGAGREPVRPVVCVVVGLRAPYRPASAADWSSTGSCSTVPSAMAASPDTHRSTGVDAGAPCGAVGCAEAYVSGTSIAARTREAVTASMAAGELPPSSPSPAGASRT